MSFTDYKAMIGAHISEKKSVLIYGSDMKQMTKNGCGSSISSTLSEALGIRRYRPTIFLASLHILSFEPSC